MKALPPANILESMGDAFVALDTEWRYTYMNQKAGQIFNRRPEDMIGKHIWTEFPEGIGQPFYKAYYKAVETQTPVYLEEYYPPYDRWFENRIYPSPDGLAIFFQDITERKRAEQALRESEERLARIVETVPDGIAIVNREGQITFANAAAERIFGLKRGGITDRTYDDPGWRITALDGSPFPQEELPFLRVKQSGQPVVGVEHAIEHPGGRRVMLSINAAPLREAGGGFDGMVAAITDITERKQAEEALRESEEKFSTAFHSSPVAFGIASLDGKFVEANRALCDLAGYSREEIVGKTVIDLGLLSAPDREKLAASIQSAGGSVHNTELQFHVRDGSFRDIFYSLETMSLNGVPHRLAIGIDITERKRAEAALAEAQRQTEEALTLFKTLLDNAPVGFAFVDVDYRYVHINFALAEMNGFPIKAHLGQTVPELIPELWPTLEPLYRQVLITGQPVTNVEVSGETARAPGQQRQWLVGYYPVRAPGGKMLGLGVLVTEITERKRAEEALRQNEEKLRKVMDGLGPYMFVGLMTPDGTLIEANQPALAAAGLRPEDVIGKQFDQTYWWAYSESVQRQLRAAVLRAAAGTPSRYDVQVRADETAFIWIDFSLHPLRDDAGTVTFLVPSAIVITERKQAEEELRRNEQVLRLFVEHSPAAIAMFDRDMKYIVASRRYLIDYDLGEQSVAGRSHYEIFPEIPERWKQIHRRCLAGAIERAEEDPFPRASGKLDWIRWEIRPWYERAGEIGGIILFSEVITERKQAEAALRESERRFREMLADLQLIAVMLDLEGRVTFCNDYLLTLAGWQREEALGQDWFAMFVPGERDDVRQTFLAALPAGDISAYYENPILTRSGEQRDILWNNTILRDTAGNVIGTASIGEDITERKRAEEALRESRRNLLALIENTEGFIFAADREYKIITANENFLHEASRQLGRPVRIGDAVMDEPASQSEIHRQRKERYDRALRGERFTVELELKPDSGSQWRQYWFSPIHNEEGGITGFTAFARDITERKQAEADLRENRERLQLLSQQLLTAQEAERRHIARELHDEIGQAFTALKLNLQSLERAPAAAGLGPPIQESIGIVEHAIQQVRNLSVELRPSLLDDLGLIPALRWHLDRYTQRTGTAVHFTADPATGRPPPEIETVCFRVTQEALTNVARHAQARQVWVDLRQSSDELRLTIRDDGTGFDARAARERAARGGSFGLLGMEERVLLIGGKIEIDSGPGEGTEIKISFPIPDPDPKGLRDP